MTHNLHLLDRVIIEMEGGEEWLECLNRVYEGNGENFNNSRAHMKKYFVEKSGDVPVPGKNTICKYCEKGEVVGGKRGFRCRFCRCLLNGLIDKSGMYI